MQSKLAGSNFKRALKSLFVFSYNEQALILKILKMSRLYAFFIRQLPAFGRTDPG